MWDPKFAGCESVKTRWRAIPWTKGRGLDLGCGADKLLDNARCLGIDNCYDSQAFGTPIKPDINADITDLSFFSAGSFDYAFSSFTLQCFPLEVVPSILREWMRVLRVGGRLILYLPDGDGSGFPRVGEPTANIYQKWDCSYAQVVALMEKAWPAWDLVDFERCPDDPEYALWFVWKKMK